MNHPFYPLSDPVSSINFGVTPRHTEMKLEMASHWSPSWMVLEPLFTPRWTCEVGAGTGIWMLYCTVVLMKPNRKTYQLYFLPYFTIYHVSFSNCSITCKPPMIIRAPASTIPRGPRQSISRGQPEGLKAEWMRLKWIELMGKNHQNQQSPRFFAPFSFRQASTWRDNQLFSKLGASHHPKSGCLEAQSVFCLSRTYQQCISYSFRSPSE